MGAAPDRRLGPRFTDALTHATWLHRDQTRKGTDIPYVTHLLSVAALVLEHGGTEDQAIAGLLHDALEDQPDRITPEQIAERYGEEVSRLVLACTDVTPEEIRSGTRPVWRARKERFLRHLETVDEDALLVSCADKVHNARTLLLDLRALGDALWDRFNAGREGQLWYQRSLADVFGRRLPGPLSDELTQTVAGLDTASA